MAYDFDTFVERRASGSEKWRQFDHDVLPMWIADMDFKAPDAVIAALRGRVEHGIFGYHFDEPALRDNLIERLRLRHAITINPDEIVFIPGLVTALNFVSHLIGVPGDGVLTLTPIYPPFLKAPKHQQRIVQTAPLAVTRDGQRLHYEIDFDALEAAVTPQTRLFMLCNPHNPVGRTFTRAELEGLSEFCLRHDLIVASDEIHCDLLYPGEQHISLASLSPEIANRCITLMAPSKTFNLPGLALGFAVVQNSDLLKRLRDHQTGMGSFVNALGYTAALAAYRDGQDWLDQAMRYLEQNRETAIRFIDEHMPDITTTRPQATYLLWLDCRAVSLPGDKSPYAHFLEQGRVALNDGAAFGEPGRGFVRLNYATSRDTVIQGLERMKSAYDALRVSAG
ncbi:MAG: PatB family C-S lyase [Anaerolineae bacterium]|nr:PatB family C-S lyase [Anaerolineae bacterium]